MKDFRKIPGNSSSGSYMPGSCNHSPDNKNSFVSFALVTLAIFGLGYYFYLKQSPALEENSKDSNQEESWITKLSDGWDEFQSKWIDILEETERSREEDITTTTSDNESEKDENLELDAKLLEYNAIDFPDRTEYYGIVKNNSSFIMGRVKVIVKVGDSPEEYVGYISTASLKPGESSPFLIRVNSPMGDLEPQFQVYPIKHYAKNLPDVKYKINNPKWEKKQFIMNYIGTFSLLSEETIRFPQLVFAFRDKNGKIYHINSHYIATKEEDYTMEGNSKKDFSMSVFGQKEIPDSMDVFFSFLPGKN